MHVQQYYGGIHGDDDVRHRLGANHSRPLKLCLQVGQVVTTAKIGMGSFLDQLFAGGGNQAL
jgi:hypothetical protein